MSQVLNVNRELLEVGAIFAAFRIARDEPSSVLCQVPGWGIWGTLNL